MPQKTEPLVRCIAAGIQVLGHEEIWYRVFVRFGMNFDLSLRLHLRQLDIRKKRKMLVARTTTEKAKRSAARYTKLSNAQIMEKQARKEGTEYESGIALREATKLAKDHFASKIRNPPGTPKEMLRCRFPHPEFCDVLGRTSCRSKECKLHLWKPEDRDAAAKTIPEEIRNRELVRINQNRK